MTIKSDVVGILRDNHCSSMDFSIAGLRINGAGLRHVSNCIANDHIVICPRDQMGAPARYRMTRDEMHIRTRDFRANDRNVRSLIVHEAVHALSDVRNLTRMTNSQSESAGFLAQTLYKLKARNGRPWRSRVTIFQEALAIITRLRLHQRQGIVVQPRDYASLRDAIRQHPNYEHDDPAEAAGANGIRRRRVARCSID